MEQEDDAAGYLGVKITKTEDGQIEMKQTGLIDRIVEALGLDSKLSTSQWTPAEAMPLMVNLLKVCLVTLVSLECCCTCQVI